MNGIVAEPWVQSMRKRLDIQHKALQNLMLFIKENAFYNQNVFIIPIFSQPNELYQLYLIVKMGVMAVLSSIGFIQHTKTFLYSRLNTEYDILIQTIQHVYKCSSHEYLLQEEIRLLYQFLEIPEDSECSCYSCTHGFSENVYDIENLQTRTTINSPPLTIPSMDAHNRNVTFENNDIDFHDMDDIDDLESFLSDLETVPVRMSLDEYSDKIRCFITNQFPEGSCCSICLESLKVSNDPNSFQWNNIIVQTPCSHWFHDSCLKKQLCFIGPPKCPNCRSDIREP